MAEAPWGDEFERTVCQGDTLLEPEDTLEYIHAAQRSLRSRASSSKSVATIGEGTYDSAFVYDHFEEHVRLGMLHQEQQLAEEQMVSGARRFADFVVLRKSLKEMVKRAEADESEWVSHPNTAPPPPAESPDDDNTTEAPWQRIIGSRRAHAILKDRVKRREALAALPKRKSWGGGVSHGPKAEEGKEHTGSLRQRRASARRPVSDPAPAQQLARAASEPQATRPGDSADEDSGSLGTALTQGADSEPEKGNPRRRGVEFGESVTYIDGGDGGNTDEEGRADGGGGEDDGGRSLPGASLDGSPQPSPRRSPDPCEGVAPEVDPVAWLSSLTPSRTRYQRSTSGLRSESRYWMAQHAAPLVAAPGPGLGRGSGVGEGWGAPWSGGEGERQGRGEAERQSEGRSEGEGEGLGEREGRGEGHANGPSHTDGATDNVQGSADSLDGAGGPRQMDSEGQPDSQSPTDSEGCARSCGQASSVCQTDELGQVESQGPAAIQAVKSEEASPAGAGKSKPQQGEQTRQGADDGGDDGGAPLGASLALSAGRSASGELVLLQQQQQQRRQQQARLRQQQGQGPRSQEAAQAGDSRQQGSTHQCHKPQLPHLSIFAAGMQNGIGILLTSPQSQPAGGQQQQQQQLLSLSLGPPTPHLAPAPLVLSPLHPPPPLTSGPSSCSSSSSPTQPLPWGHPAASPSDPLPYALPQPPLQPLQLQPQPQLSGPLSRRVTFPGEDLSLLVSLACEPSHSPKQQQQQQQQQQQLPRQPSAGLRRVSFPGEQEALVQVSTFRTSEEPPHASLRVRSSVRLSRLDLTDQGAPPASSSPASGPSPKRPSPRLQVSPSRRVTFVGPLDSPKGFSFPPVTVPDSGAGGASPSGSGGFGGFGGGGGGDNQSMHRVRSSRRSSCPGSDGPGAEGEPIPRPQRRDGLDATASVAAAADAQSDAASLTPFDRLLATLGRPNSGVVRGPRGAPVVSSMLKITRAGSGAGAVGGSSGAPVQVPTAASAPALPATPRPEPPPARPLTGGRRSVGGGRRASDGFGATVDGVGLARMLAGQRPVQPAAAAAAAAGVTALPPVQRALPVAQQQGAAVAVRPQPRRSEPGERPEPFLPKEFVFRPHAAAPAVAATALVAAAAHVALVGALPAGTATAGGSGDVALLLPAVKA